MLNEMFLSSISHFYAIFCFYFKRSAGSSLNLINFFEFEWFSMSIIGIKQMSNGKNSSPKPRV